MTKETKHFLKVYVPIALVIAAVFAVAYSFIEPAPPDHVRIASGSPHGAYYRYAQAYARELAKEGITLEVVQTAGSVENIRLLRQGKVDVALVQGGVEAPVSEPALYSLGSLYYEPLWLFLRQGIDIDRLGALQGLRVSVGATGSGTRVLVLRLLRANGLSPDDPGWHSLGSAASLKGLLDGSLEAAFFVGSPQGSAIARLLRSPAVHLFGFSRAAAYARRYRFLNDLVLPRGVVDLAQDLPPVDRRLVAPAANLVVSEDTHPAINDLLLQAATRVHEEGDWFAARGEFPQPRLLAYPLAEEARRYYAHGPPFLQRYLPFWAASLIDRLKVMLLPLILMLLPLFKWLPPIYNWRMASRIYRWYDQLEGIERGLAQGTLSLAQAREALQRIDEAVRRLEVPASYGRQLYLLRQHIALVRDQLAAGPQNRSMSPLRGTGRGSTSPHSTRSP
ncbi:MAG: TAXI family TRAP transporter solute-binding subunit [Gammaproteobacteria bacterium]|nr:MAG: TAXI family TRAP transporter solute-binding subunit [Gammaproteobacteria bacterium]